MSVPGLGTYNMQLSAEFGQVRSATKGPVPGHVLGVYIHSSMATNCCGIYPLYTDGKIVILNSPGEGEAIERSFKNFEIEANSSMGWSEVCDDILQKQYSGGDWIQIEATLTVKRDKGENPCLALTSR